MEKPEYEAHVAKVMKGGRIRISDGVIAGLGVEDGSHIIFYREKGSAGPYRVGKLKDLVQF